MSRLQLTVLTLNLLYAAGSENADEDEAGTWPQRLPLVVSLCEKWRPDVLAFQECQDVQWRDLERELGKLGYVGCVGPKNGTDRAPRWSRFLAPLLWLGAAVLARSKFRFSSPLAALFAVLGVVPVVFTLILKRAKGQACEDGGHCPIFFRTERFELQNEGTFWISDAPQTPDSLLPGAWLPRICHWRERESKSRFQVFNTHLDWWFLARSRGGKIVARHSSTWNALIEESQTHRAGVLFDALENAGQKNGAGRNVSRRQRRAGLSGPHRPHFDAPKTARRIHRNRRFAARKHVSQRPFPRRGAGGI